MGYFQNIKLENYRNFDFFEVDFSKDCNVLFGRNGSGKTNILEAISLFEKGKGFRKDSVKDLVNYKNNKNFKISSNFVNQNNKIKLLLQSSLVNNAYYKKLSVNENSTNESINFFQNLFSTIHFLPEMERLFLNNPSSRRNFIDRLIFNIDKKYNLLINKYKKNILERYKILKNYNYEIEWVELLEKTIVDQGIQIYKKRLNHLNIINSYLHDLESFEKYNYKFSLILEDNLIKNFNQDIENIYEHYLKSIEKSREADSIIGGCKIGPHKSDFVGYNIENNININKLSTGQQKTVILLIIIAQCKFLIKETKINPIILFDEVCSHLDQENRALLLDLIEVLNIQIFMTGTEKNFFSFLSNKTSYCNIKQ